MSHGSLGRDNNEVFLANQSCKQHRIICFSEGSHLHTREKQYLAGKCEGRCFHGWQRDKLHEENKLSSRQAAAQRQALLYRVTKPRGIKCKEMPGNTDQVQQISSEPSVIISNPQISSQISGAHQLLQREGLQRGSCHLRFPSAVKIHFAIKTRLQRHFQPCHRADG